MNEITEKELNQDQINTLNSFDDPSVVDREYKEFVRMQSDTNRVLNLTSPSIMGDINAVRNLFSNPLDNYARIAGAVEELFNTNGVIRSIVKYLQSHVTYNHSIYPIANQDNIHMSDNPAEYIDIANQVENYNIKYFAPYFVKEILIKGIIFLYEIGNDDSISYLQFPTSWGRVYEMDNGLYKWEIDISNIREVDEELLPDEIVKAVETFANGNTDGDDWSKDGKWYRLSDKAFAMTLDPSVMSSGVAISELANTLLDSAALENAKRNVDVKDELDTVRLLHAKIPIDSDGKIKMSPQLAKQYNMQISRSLPEGIKSAVTPLELSNIALNGGGTPNAYEMVDKAEEKLFLATGTPSNIFGAETSSSRIVQFAIQKDANWIYTNVFPALENYYNYRLRSMSTESGMRWKVKFIRQSYYSMKEDIANMQAQLSFGGSRLDYLAAIGMDPAEVIGKLRMEQEMLDIDSIMTPKPTSYTLSGEGEDGSTQGSKPTGSAGAGTKKPKTPSNVGGSGEVGRPETDIPSPDTERQRDAQ